MERSPRTAVASVVLSILGVIVALSIGGFLLERLLSSFIFPLIGLIVLGATAYWFLK